MPHLRIRHISPLLKKTLSYSPIVGIFGHRQVGKTTLVTGITDNYRTLDDPVQLVQATEDPRGFIQSESKAPLCIDECQMAPPLFPALKEWVRTHPKPGQFLLTGSVRFSSRKSIRESLTGRIIAWELLPMDLSETAEAPLPNTLPLLLKSKTVEVPLKIPKYFSDSSFKKALENGGLPGVFAIRDTGIRIQRFETMLHTLLERDLQLILKTTIGYSTLRNLLKSLALIQGKPLAWSDLARSNRISVPSLRKLIQAFEAMFLIRLIPTEGSEKKPVLYFEDQGEASYLSENRYDDTTQLLRFLYSQLRVQIHYRPELNATLFQYRNRGGASVPLCFRSQKHVLGIIPIPTENLQPQWMTTAKSFMRAYPGAKVLFVHQGSKDEILSPQVRVLGAGLLL